MVTITVSMARELKQFVGAQLTSGRYGSASEYVCALIREELRRRQPLEARLMEGTVRNHR